MVIQRNMQAFNANRQLNMVENAREKSSEKLSSGYKVNRSADDAAGLSISEKMRRQIRGLTRAGENVEDGISLCQVIDGAMTEMHDMVNRMNELCVQAANGTNEESDRMDIQMEIDALVTEFGRIIDTTKFNELYVFREDKTWCKGAKHDEDEKPVTQSRGYSLGEVDGVKVWKESKLSDKFSISFVSPGQGWNVSTFNGLRDSTHKIASRNDRECAWVDFTNFEAASEDDLIKQLDNRGFDSSCCFCQDKFYGVKFVSKLDDDKLKLQTTSGINFNYHKSTPTGLTSEVLKINLKDIWQMYEAQGGNSGSAKLGNLICETLFDVITMAGERYASNLTKHYTSYAYKQGTAKLYLFNNIDDPLTDPLKVGRVLGNQSTFSTMPRDDNGYVEQNKPIVDKVDEKKEPRVKIFNPKRQIFIQAGEDAIFGNKIRINLPTTSLETLGLNEVKVLTEALATNSINLLTKTQRLLSEDRSRIGGYQNRLEHTARNLDNVVENTSASESRIRDTDMADEMVRHVGNNILSQAGQSMLSQANTRMQKVLALLAV